LHNPTFNCRRKEEEKEKEEEEANQEIEEIKLTSPLSLMP
jgi:hypothetical protein